MAGWVLRGFPPLRCGFRLETGGWRGARNSAGSISTGWVCLSRFLIRPSVGCPHLASHVLGRMLRRLPRDFETRYGFRPWLVESFADAGYDGTCLRAANFLCVGETTGRGRQDREKRRGKTVKRVFVYSLVRNWRRKLGVPWVEHAPVLQPGDGLNATDWAENEFGGAPLGDKRLSARLVKSVGLLAAYPGQKIHANSASDSTAINAFYRLIEMPAESAVTVENILAPHRERSVQRVRAQRTVLAIQDGTDLNFATRPGCDGLQLIGKNQTGAKSLGLHLHATMAVTDTGLPLGMLRLGFDPLEKRPAAAETRRKTLRWLDGFTDIARAVREVGGKTRVISVCDREADVFELFDAQRRSARVDLLVRAKHDRVLGKGKPKLFATLRSGAPDGRIDVEVDGLTARPKSSRKQVRPSRCKRLANCELRFRRVTLPATEAMEGAEPMTVSAVHVVETAPPEDEDPVEWFLLTTLKVGAAKEAADIVGFYLQRWRIEDFFRVLKIRLPGGVPAVPYRRPPAAGDRHQRRYRLAHHGHDPARPAGARLRAATDVRRPGTRIPAQLCPRERSRDAGPARRCGPPGGPSRRIPRPKARS